MVWFRDLVRVVVGQLSKHPVVKAIVLFQVKKHHFLRLWVAPCVWKMSESTKATDTQLINIHSEGACLFFRQRRHKWHWAPNSEFPFQFCYKYVLSCCFILGLGSLAIFYNHKEKMSAFIWDSVILSSIKIGAFRDHHLPMGLNLIALRSHP